MLPAVNNDGCIVTVQLLCGHCVWSVTDGTEVLLCKLHFNLIYQHIMRMDPQSLPYVTLNGLVHEETQLRGGYKVLFFLNIVAQQHSIQISCCVTSCFCVNLYHLHVYVTAW